MAADGHLSTLEVANQNSLQGCVVAYRQPELQAAWVRVTKSSKECRELSVLHSTCYHLFTLFSRQPPTSYSEPTLLRGLLSHPSD